jgi:hypothetical protein
MTKTIPGLAARCAGAVAASMLAAACSSGSPTAAASGTSQNADGSGATVTTGTSIPAGGAAKATCSQLKASDVQGLMTNPVVATPDVTQVGTDGDGQQCVFHDADSEQAVDILVFPASDPINYTYAKQHAKKPETLAGVGDQAFNDDGQPTAEHNGLMCTASTGTETQIPGADALIVNGTLNLTDAQNAVIAAALGTVCNRVFGTGNTTPDLSGL